MKQRARIVIAGLLAVDILVTALLLLGPSVLGDTVIACVGIATLARVALSVAWISLSESIPRATSVTVLLLGLEALTFVYLYFTEGLLAPTDDQAWAHISVLIANSVVGPALVLLLIILLLARRGGPAARRE